MKQDKKHFFLRCADVLLYCCSAALLLCCSAAQSYAAPAEVWETGQTKCYQGVSPYAEIACAGTRQDGDKKAGVAWPIPRFTDNGNGTVTDNLTGLIWLKNANCFSWKTWQAALDSSNALASSQCGLSDGSQAGDWRLPNRKELLSLVDYSKFYPALPASHPFTNAQSDLYWSSSTYASYSYNAWFVNMYNGYVYKYLSHKTNSLYVWPVRGGQSGSFCNLAIAPSTQTFTSSGGTGSVTVTASASSCAWTATSSLSWVTITSGSSGTGSGTVYYSVSSNTTGASRTGYMTIAGQTFTVTQSAQLGSFTVTPSAGAGGSISPSTPQTVAQGSTTTFTVTPTTGYSIASVTGCGGTISGITYTTGPITADCTVAASFTQSSSKYTDNNNGTITDNTTGLTWQKGENPATYNWFQASGTYDATYNPSTQNVCGSLTFAGGGWRLPRVNELQSLVDTGFNPTIDTNFFPSAHGNYYLSATTNAYDTLSARVVDFGSGYVGSGVKLDGSYVRCVRGIQSDGLLDTLSILEQADTSDTDYSKTPLILVHGMHGSFDANYDGILHASEASIDEKGKDYWANFKSYFNSIPVPLVYSPLKAKYKLYIFSYLSDSDTVQNIAASLNARIENTISSGKMKNGKIVILAHSMGGLVARSYMQEWGGSARIDKLITLATPHHGTPGANDKDALTYNGITEKENFIAAQYLYYTFGTSAPSYMQSNQSNEPNRSDLRWDNYSGSPLIVQDYDKNQWLSDLNADSSNDNKIIAYFGYIDPTRPAYKFLLDKVSLLGFDVVALGVFKDDHIRLLIMSALMSGALKSNSLLLWYDGMVPWESGSFYGHTVAKKVSCLDYDHLDMKDGSTKTCALTGKTLFDSVKDNLLSLTVPTSCTYTIKPASKTFTSSGGTGNVTVTSSASSCAWTASSTLSWATITSGSSGTGSGTVAYSVSANTSKAARTGNITIAGKTFTITQKGKK